MDFALHTGCMPHANLAAQVDAARWAGFDGIELSVSKLERYLGAGLTVEDLALTLGPLRVTMLNVLMSIERFDRGFRTALRAQCERMASAASALGCPAIQVVALDGFAAADSAAIQKSVVESLRELSELAAPHNVKLALEPVTFSPFNRLDRALEVVAEVGPDRVGLVLDTWHLWTSGTAWGDVAVVDPTLVSTVHLSDTARRASSAWQDEDRWPLPGEGILPLGEATTALRASGYDGTWAVELVSEEHAEWHPRRLATELLDRMRHLLEVDAARGATR